MKVTYRVVVNEEPVISELGTVVIGIVGYRFGRDILSLQMCLLLPSRINVNIDASLGSRPLSFYSVQ